MVVAGWLQQRRTSLSLFCHSSLSRGPALTVSSGIFCTVALVVGSHESPMAADAAASSVGWDEMRCEGQGELKAAGALRAASRKLCRALGALKQASISG